MDGLPDRVNKQAPESLSLEEARRFLKNQIFHSEFWILDSEFFNKDFAKC